MTIRRTLPLCLVFALALWLPAAAAAQAQLGAIQGTITDQSGAVPSCFTPTRQGMQEIGEGVL